MTKHRWRGKVPMYEDGRGLCAEGDVWLAPITWQDWHTFEATLTIDKTQRWGHVARFVGTDRATGRTYPIFMADLLAILDHGVQPSGEVTGTWGFCKRGMNYGVYLITDTQKGQNDVEKVD